MTRNRALCLAIAIQLVVPALALGPADAGTHEEWVVTSDGVGLATTVVLPDTGAGPWPVILIRTPYTAFGPVTDQVESALGVAALMGIATVMQDTRGQGDSEGTGDPFFTDRADGQETLDWVLAQEWCDGRVAGGGASAIGIPQYLMAPGADPAMHCQAVAIATPDVFGAAFRGGVLKRSDVRAWSRWVDADGIVERLSAQRDCDGFWDSVRAADEGADVSAATLHLGGWFDPFTEGILLGFEMYRAAADPWVADHQYLVMGPWEHFTFGGTEAGDLAFPPNARYDVMTEALRWLQWCFDKGGAAVNGWPTVRYYVMGDVDDPDAPGNEWRTADDWPPFEAEELPFHLQADGALLPETPLEAFEIVVPFDPADPSPTVGGSNLVGAAGPLDQQAVEARGDALVFTSAVLEEPIEATGAAVVQVDVATSGPDGDVVVRLTDVYPDGRSLLLADGAQRISRRDGCAAAAGVEPGVVYPLTIPLLTTSHVFNVGHRIRLIVTGSSYPRYELNPAVAAGGAPIELRFASGPDRPATLVLPVPPDDPPPPPDAVEPVAEPVDVVEAVDAGADVVEAVEIVSPPPDGDGVDTAPPDQLDAEFDAGVDAGVDAPGPAPPPDLVAPDGPAPGDAAPVTDAVPAGAGSSGGCTSTGWNSGAAAPPPWPLATLLLLLAALTLAGRPLGREGRAAPGR